ncbi:MAG: putative ABC transport system ATP-binding protein [Candidatus Omnitrophota bacterium]|jgi:putative ABC transport system ATP-binding protein
MPSAETTIRTDDPVIFAQGITKVYDMGETQVHALRGVDFIVERGEFVAIVGQSGSGKSTLMHLLGCLDTPTDGRIIIGGEDVSHASQAELAEIRNATIGFVFQTFNLLPRFSLLRNTQLPMTYGGISARNRRRRATELLDRVGLGDRLDHRPNQLSGGQCQRAAIARALVTNPDIILADEPTGNLDSASGEIILNILKDLHREGHTVILVTHDNKVAQAAHRQIRILDGCIVEDTGVKAPISEEESPMTTETPTESLTPTLPEAPRKRKRKKRRWLKVLIVLAVLAGIGWGAKRMFAPEAADPMASLKEPIHVERGVIEERLMETGTVELRTTIEVKSKMSGKVKELLVEEGDAVKEGDVLAIIEPDPNEILRLYQKRAAVESRQLELAENRRELTRSVELHDRGVLPGDQFEKIRDRVTASETNYRLALLELQALEREIDPAIDAATPSLSEEKPGEIDTSVLGRLTDIRVLSPRSGIVIERTIDVGELVISGTATTIAGTTIMKLGDPAEAVVKASVNEIDIGKIKAGQQVEVTLGAYEDEQFPAQVHRIAPIGVKPQGQGIVSFNVEVRFAKLDPRIMPGMTCDLDIVLERKEDAQTLPFSAIFQERPDEEKEEKKKTRPGKMSAAEPKPIAEKEAPYLDYVWVKDGEDWGKEVVTLGLKGLKNVEILTGPDVESAVYPDAERLRWLLKEKAAKAKKKRWFKKAPNDQ